MNARPSPSKAGRSSRVHDGNIYLVGFMGAGKTSVGQRLAEILQWDFVDLDVEIEKREGRPIREIFSTEGEPHFRRLESEELQRVSGCRRTVVALGGGAFVDERNRELVAKTGTSVWLDASMETLYSRCGEDPLRPLASSRGEMERLLERRRPFYGLAAIRIEVAGLSIDEIARGIRDAINRESGP